MATPNYFEVHLAGAYKLANIDSLLLALHPLLFAQGPIRVLLDLEDLTFLSPSALAILSAALVRVREERFLAEGTLIEPKSAKVQSYLERMGVMELGIGRPRTGPRKQAVGFRECRQFSTDYNLVARDLVAAIAEQCETDDVARRSLRLCLDEVTENVVHHADSKSGGFVAAQGWREDQQMELAIVDLGRGIRASLTANPDYAGIGSDVQAVEKALELRVTATPDRNGGIGLFVTRHLLRANGGLLHVRSGLGWVYDGASQRSGISPAYLPGTLVVISARTDRPLDINAVMRYLKELEGNTEDDDDVFE